MVNARGTSIRAVVAISTIAALASLTGCMLPAPPDEPVQTAPSSVPAPSSSTEVSEEARPEPSTEPSEPSDVGTSGSFTFEDGANLTEDAMVEWNDGMIASDDWEYTSPDDGNGNWGYTAADGSCTADFSQTRITDIEVSGEDSEDSDRMIAFILDSEVEDVTAEAADVGLSYMTPGNDGLEARGVAFTADGRTGIFVARAFSSVGVGLSVYVDCADNSNQSGAEIVNELNAVFVLE